METILLMTDFSDNAKNAIKYAVKLFGTDVNYILLHTYVVRENTGSFISVADKIKALSEKGMTKEVAFLKEEYPTLKVSPLLLRGGAIDGVHAVQKEHPITLIVMGTKGASGLSKLLIGSVTVSVVQGAGLPVLIVPENQAYHPINKITFATDFSEEIGNMVLAPLRALASKSNAEITLLNVLAEKETVSDLAKLETLKTTLFDGFITTTAVIEQKDRSIDEMIERYCRKHKTDLLTVVAHHNGFFEKLFHHSVSKELIFHAQLPILALDESFRTN